MYAGMQKDNFGTCKNMRKQPDYGIFQVFSGFQEGM